VPQNGDVRGSCGGQEERSGPTLLKAEHVIMFHRKIEQTDLAFLKIEQRERESIPYYRLLR